MTCKEASKIEKCTPGLYHGIDSLEEYQMIAINATALRLHALNGSFDDTVARVVWAPLNASHTGPFDPKYCVKAPPASTRDSNCTTTLTAYFSDAKSVITSRTLQACGLVEWVGKRGPYGAWAHANEPRRAPASDMCAFQAADEVYHEV